MRTLYEIVATIVTLAFCLFTFVVYTWPTFARLLR